MSLHMNLPLLLQMVLRNGIPTSMDVSPIISKTTEILKGDGDKVKFTIEGFAGIDESNPRKSQ